MKHSIVSWAQTIFTWNNPVPPYNYVMKFKKVEFTDTATIVSIHVMYSPSNQFGIPSNINS